MKQELHSLYGMGGSSPSVAGDDEGRIPLYADEGCRLADSCLECPFTDCLFGDDNRGKSTPIRAAKDILKRWPQSDADKPRLFKAAMVCLKEPGVAETLGPQFMEELNAYGSTQSGS